MKIWVHRYKLTSTNEAFKSREGALVKAEWALGQTGYSDLHPWPELGEPSLDEHIASLASVNLTPLAENTLEFNYIDREYRLNKKNAFSGLIIPRSHKLIVDVRSLESSHMQQFQKQGYTHIKLKMGSELKAETEALVQLAYSSNILWRIDFNGKFSVEEVTAWWKSLDAAVQMRIDFVEDPTDNADMKIVGPWANDFKVQKQALVRVLKPAREGVEELTRYNRVVFTHGLDHPLGQACAAWAAARFYSQHPKKLDVCGLTYPDFYEPNEFCSAWISEGPKIKAPQGFGFGFDKLLESTKWERVL